MPINVTGPPKPTSRSASAARVPHSPAPMITIPAIGSDFDEDIFALDLHRVGVEVDADRRTPGGAGAVVEAAVVLRALDDVVHHQPVGEMDLLVGAEAVGGEELAVRGVVDREGSALVVEAGDVFLVDVLGRAGANPAGMTIPPVVFLIDRRPLGRSGGKCAAAAASAGGAERRHVEVLAVGLGGRQATRA